MANRKRYEKEKHRTSNDSTTHDIPLDNRYHLLTDLRNDDTNTGTADPNAAKPPPIFVYGFNSLPEMRKSFNEFLDEEHYTTKVWQTILLN
jgi:hypothetical protein